MRRVLKRLRKMIRKDVSVILNGRGQTFADALHPRGAAVLNCFLAFLLHIDGEFTYVQGDLGDFDRSRVSLMSPAQAGERGGPGPTRVSGGEAIETRYSVDRVIVRHGTEREEGFEAPRPRAGCHRPAEAATARLRPGREPCPPVDGGMVEPAAE